VPFSDRYDIDLACNLWWRFPRDSPLQPPPGSSGGKLSLVQCKARGSAHQQLLPTRDEIGQVNRVISDIEEQVVCLSRGPVPTPGAGTTSAWIQPCSALLRAAKELRY